MFSTQFIILKDQCKGISIGDIKDYFITELHLQQVSEVIENDVSLDFKNNISRVVWNPYQDKFGNFSNGQIKIIDQQNTFIIILEANAFRIVENAGMIAAIFPLIILIFEFSIIPLIIGTIIFVLFLSINSIFTYLFFPVYWKTLQYDIERQCSNY